MPHHVSERMLMERVAWRVWTSIQPRNLSGNLSSCSQETMPTATRRVDDPQPKQGFSAALRIVLEGLLDDRNQCGFDEFIHEYWRGVVAACYLTLRTAYALRLFLPNETESPGRYCNGG